MKQDKTLNPQLALLGLYPNEIAQLVKLPDHLASHPYLIEYYGTVEWSVKVCQTCSLNVMYSLSFNQGQRLNIKNT